MDIIYLAAWRHRNPTARRLQSLPDAGYSATLRLVLVVFVIGTVVGFLDLAATRTPADKDGEAIVIVQTSEGDGS